MGYFSFGAINFIYKIYRSKKFRKFIIGFGFLAFVLITIFNNTTFAAQSDSEFTTDTTIAILEAYQRNVDMFVLSFNRWYGKNDIYTARFNTLFSRLTTFSTTQYLYLRHYSIDNDNLNCLMYNKSEYNISPQVTTNWLCDGPNGSYMAIPTTGYNITFVYNMNIPINTLSPSAGGFVSTTDFIPSILMWRMPEEIVECMQQAGYGYSGPVADIKQMISDMKETQEDIYNTLNAEPDDDEANTDINNILVDNTTDVTDGGFNNIFNTIKDGFTNPTNTSVTITIPFTNKYFVINTMSIYGGNYFTLRNSVIGQLIQTFWWFVLGIFVYKDIAHIVNKVKSGEIEGIENTNIKEDLL